ncbi:MAG: transcription-repair coupling factor, partial [Chloroflexota bacterium]
MPPDLRPLLTLAHDMPEFDRLVEQLLHQRHVTRLVAPDAARPYVIAALYRSLERPLLVLTAQPKQAKKLQEQLAVWCYPAEVVLFPEPDALPYERLVSDAATELARLRVLSRLAGIGGHQGNPSAAPPLVVTAAPALMRLTPSYRDFTAVAHTVEAGMTVDPLELLARWQAMGYRLESTVAVPGTMARRGGIVDIYPPTSPRPVRLEFFGNTVDSLRRFDPATQRSREAVPAIVVGPATELLVPPKDRLAGVLAGLDLSSGTDEVRERFRQELAGLLEGPGGYDRLFYAPLFPHGSLLDYLPPETMVVIDEPDSLEPAVADLAAQAAEWRQLMVTRGELPLDFPRPYFTWEELEPLIREKPCLELAAWGPPGDDNAYRLGFTPAAGYAGRLAAFLSKARQRLGQRQRLILVSQQAGRLAELLGEADIIAAPVEKLGEVPPPGSLTLVTGSLAEGWTMGRDTHLFTDAELFGFAKERRAEPKRAAPYPTKLVDITPGDFVVHVEHGVGRFAGVARMGADGGEREYLILQYAAGDRLYVPADQIGRVDRYIEGGEAPPVLSRLGTQEWARTKQRVKASVADVARELLALYASRQVVTGFAFSPDTVWQQELEAAFPYVETPDQMAVQWQVKADMEQPRPMDRLVCGDVGYGKTEVALRAAFKAVMDGKQVAVLVPTTVLAQQHLVTFRRRTAAFPIRIEVLSRFRTPKEQRAVLKDLATGSVDICIGTHRLLQKDVAFKDLGLLIIDEEQRFGVGHKEHFKKLRREIDVLTLSATPIPRTLHMSLVGVRDMSTIETPPEERLPIKTYVAEYQERLVREAVLREMERNGQVFFVHNRVQSIAFVASQLQALVPEARVAVAHGQMPEGELERVMAGFIQGDRDVLVCTTIIESGLDMPNVNTIIINQADKFGLTQLYQLRGRVGRGAELAYAYLLYDGRKRLTPTARQRLKAIHEATELGAGYSLAMKDLEIRGAGNLLGVKQSGNISAVGFHLYSRLLAEAVAEQKARLAGGPVAPPSSLPAPGVDLPLPAYIPEHYVADLDTRLAFYQRLVGVSDTAGVDDLGRELADRFGPPPREARNLLYAVRVRVLAARAGIESVGSVDGHLVLRCFNGLAFDRQKLESLLKD